ncbi:MAG: aspartyl protease family protein [Vulcanimicrobiaceae bacterium]
MRHWVVGISLAALFCISPAVADEQFKPSTVSVDQVFAKARSARGVLRAGAYHRVARQTNGNGTVSQIDTIEDGDDYVETFRNGDFTTGYGSYRGHDWVQDANGVVTIESGFHEREDPYAAAIRSVQSVTAQPDIKVLGVTQTEPAEIVVELMPRSGLRQRRYYDAQSFLLRRVETTDYDGITTVYAYDNFRTAFGWTFPQTIVYHDGHPENDARTEVIAFDPVPRANARIAIPATRSIFDLAGRDAVRIPADFTLGGIIVRVTIAGRGLDFELDSGAEPMIIDDSVARQLGLSLYDVRKETFGGDFTSAHTRVGELELGDLHAHDIAMEAIPWNKMVGDRKVVGLLGGDFFASGRIDVDFKNSTLSLLAPSKDAGNGPWSAIPIEIDDLVPRAHAKFNGIDGRFIVDLGADDTMMYGHYFAQFHPDKVGDVMGQVAGVASRPVDFHEYTFGRFDFGDLAFSGAHAIVASGHRWEERDYDGLLGRNILNNFNMIFDYPNRKLYVQSLVQ